MTVIKPKFNPRGEKSIFIAGMTLKDLQKDYRRRIFKEYLPFWEKGGYDKKFGGFMCELNDDGSVAHDEKFIWYQGRGIWVYSYLFNHLGRDRKFLGIAMKSRDFLVEKMYRGDGRWRESVDRHGNPVEVTAGQGTGRDIYGALFSAAGLIQLYQAGGNEADLRIALESIRWSVDEYEKPDYPGVTVPGIEEKGLRTQGHSFVLIWLLSDLLSIHNDPDLERLQKEHVDHIVNHFWNPDYGIVNEDLYHDYSRIPGHETIMFPGHSLEALWMVMYEAIRTGDEMLFGIMKDRIRRLIEMNWDYIFEGLATEEYRVFGSQNHCPGPSFELKVMWAHTELLLAAFMIYEYTGETWAGEWYEKCRAYCLRTMADTGNGVWRQAVDRSGKDKQRPGISIYRKDNFHQLRYQMMNLRAIGRMLNDYSKEI